MAAPAYSLLSWRNFWGPRTKALQSQPPSAPAGAAQPPVTVCQASPASADGRQPLTRVSAAVATAVPAVASPPLTVPLPTEGPLASPLWVSQKVAEQPWKGGLEPCGEQCYTLAPGAVSGTVPDALRGTMYMVGPGRIRVGENRYNHWFDGDGMVHGLVLDGPGGEVRYTSKWVRTPRFEAQEKAGDRRFPAVRGVWTNAAGGPLANLGLPTNPGNTSVLDFGGKICVLCEGGAPTEIDPDTLETRGPVDFGDTCAFSAHPKVHPSSGVLYNMGLEISSSISPFGLTMFSVSPSWKLLNRSQLKQDRFGTIHDCAITENHMILLVPPYGMPYSSLLKYVLGLVPIGMELKYDAARGLRFIVARLADMAVVHDSQVDAFSTYHFCNAFEADGKLHVLVAVQDGERESLESAFKDMYGSCWRREHLHTVQEMVWDTATWRLLSKQPAVQPPPGAAPPAGMEFPSINPAFLGRENRFFYALAKFEDPADPQVAPPGCNTYYDCVQKCDRATGRIETFRLPPGQYGTEPHFTVGAGGGVGGGEEDAGYLMLTAYDAKRHASTVYLLDAQKVEGPPLATIELPTHVPYYFHGSFSPKERS